jgi:hypothetical protein
MLGISLLISSLIVASLITMTIGTDKQQHSCAQVDQT